VAQDILKGFFENLIRTSKLFVDSYKIEKKQSQKE